MIRLLTQVLGQDPSGCCAEKRLRGIKGRSSEGTSWGAAARIRATGWWWPRSRGVQVGLVRSGPTLTTAAAKLAELATRPDVEWGKDRRQGGHQGLWPEHCTSDAELSRTQRSRPGAAGGWGEIRNATLNLQHELPNRHPPWLIKILFRSLQVQLTYTEHLLCGTHCGVRCWLPF